MTKVRFLPDVPTSLKFQLSNSVLPRYESWTPCSSMKRIIRRTARRPSLSITTVIFIITDMQPFSVTSVSNGGLELMTEFLCLVIIFLSLRCMKLSKPVTTVLLTLGVV